MDKNQLGNSPGTDADAITIRPATIDDAERIGELWEDLVAYHHELDAALPTAGPGGKALYARRIADSVRDSYAQTFVAEVDGLLVGFVLGMIVDLVPETFIAETGGFLADIYVVPEKRGRGIGRQLVEMLQEWFRSRGIIRMEWYVAAHNNAGISFWQRMGGRDNMIRMRVDL